MNKSKRALLYFAFLFGLACAATLLVAWAMTASPALGLSATAPTRARAFGYAQIAKPTYTFTPTVTPTAIPTETPNPMAQVEILQDTPAPAYEPQPNYVGGKYILVDISEQHMYVYENEALVYSFIASTGIYNGTRVGQFSVLEKIPNAYGSTWDIWMPHWLGIYWSGNLQNGIHALPILPNGATLWAGYLGTPISYGCVVLGSYEAEVLYNWADVGTPVEIQR